MKKKTTKKKLFYLSFLHLLFEPVLANSFNQCFLLPWWRHQMETISALLTLCAGNSPVIGEIPAQRPVTRSFDVFFDLRLNKRWVNNRDDGDLRRHRAHYDVTVMHSRRLPWLWWWWRWLFVISVIIGWSCWPIRARKTRWPKIKFGTLNTQMSRQSERYFADILNFLYENWCIFIQIYWNVSKGPMQ